MNENDLGSAINKLLADPEALSGIMQMASGLMANVGTASDSEEPQDKVPRDVAQNVSAVTELTSSLPDLSVLGGILSGGGGKDPRCDLLRALRPFMNGPRAEKIDQLINLLRIADIAVNLLSGRKAN